MEDVEVAPGQLVQATRDDDCYTFQIITIIDGTSVDDHLKKFVGIALKGDLGIVVGAGFRCTTEAMFIVWPQCVGWIWASDIETITHYEI